MLITEELQIYIYCVQFILFHVNKKPNIFILYTFVVYMYHTKTICNITFNENIVLFYLCLCKARFIWGDRCCKCLS